MDNTKVSIIIPIHNLEGFLEKSLTSVMQQTLKDIEIICVNDASDDNSLNIIEKFANDDSRIKIINLEKKEGQGYARNRGIEIAQGEYIGFVDGDDWVELDMFEKLYNKASQTDSDMVICSNYVYDDIIQETSTNNRYYSLDLLNNSFDERIFNASDTLDEVLDFNVAAWNKIYKKDFLSKINAKFSEGFIYEDLPFFFQTYLNAQRISVLRDYLYYYRINRLGSTMSNINKLILDRVDMVLLSYNLLNNFCYYKQIKFKILRWIIEDLIYRYSLVEIRYQKEFFYKMKKAFCYLDLSGIDEETLKTINYYENFLIIKNFSFEEHMKKLAKLYEDKSYKNVYDESRIINLLEEQKILLKKQQCEITSVLKKDIAELKSDNKQIREEYKKDIINIKKENEYNLSSKLKQQKEFFDKEINSLKDFYENEIKYQTSQIEEVYNQKINEINQNHQQDLNYKNEEKLRELENQKEYFHIEIKNQLSIKDEWWIQDTDRRIKEVDEWHNNHLNQRLEEQKNNFANEKWSIEQEYLNIKQEYLKKLSAQQEIFDKKIADMHKQYSYDVKYLRKIIKVSKKIRGAFNNLKRKLKNQNVSPSKLSLSTLENKRPKVSVILPVYNVDKYLRQSLDSLINQTLKDIEIICVNDGSTDKCKEILDEYAAKDSRIKVIHKTNCGTGAARNDGLKIASGECIGFVDPDDWVKENMFERLYNLLKEKDVDIVMCTPGGFDEKNQLETDFPYFIDENFRPELENNIFNWRSVSPFSYPMCIWNKLYTKELFDKYQINFAQGLDFEDHKAIFGTLLNAEKIFFIREKLYIYRFNREGSILSDNNDRLIDHIKIFDIVEGLLHETNTYESLREDFLNYKVHNLLYYYGMIKAEHKQNYYEKMKQAVTGMNLSEAEKQMLCNKYPDLISLLP